MASQALFETPAPKRRRKGGSIDEVVDLESLGQVSFDFMRSEVERLMDKDACFVQAAWGAVKKAEKAMEIKNNAHGATTACTAVSIKSKGSDKIKIIFVVNELGLTHEKLLKVMSKDPCFLNNITVFLSQLREDMRWHEHMRIEDVALDVLRTRSANVGDRAATVKPILDRIIIDDVWQWKVMASYLVTFAAGEGEVRKLTEIRTFDGVLGVVPADTYLDSTWKLVDAHSDTAARFVKGKMPPVYCTTFFDEESKAGPYRYSFFEGSRSGAKFADLVQKRYSAWKIEKDKKAQGDKEALQTQASHKVTQKKESGAKAKQAAKNYFDKKQASATVVF